MSAQKYKEWYSIRFSWMSDKLKMSGDAGWNAVIHHPSDLELQNWNWEENDGEQEKELPSTVDMDAIKGGGSWDPATEPNGISKIHIVIVIIKT